MGKEILLSAAPELLDVAMKLKETQITLLKKSSLTVRVKNLTNASDLSPKKISAISKNTYKVSVVS